MHGSGVGKKRVKSCHWRCSRFASRDRDRRWRVLSSILEKYFRCLFDLRHGVNDDGRYRWIALPCTSIPSGVPNTLSGQSREVNEISRTNTRASKLVTNLSSGLVREIFSSDLHITRTRGLRRVAKAGGEIIWSCTESRSRGGKRRESNHCSYLLSTHLFGTFDRHRAFTAGQPFARLRINSVRFLTLRTSISSWLSSYFFFPLALRKRIGSMRSTNFQESFILFCTAGNVDCSKNFLSGRAMRAGGHRYFPCVNQKILSNVRKPERSMPNEILFSQCTLFIYHTNSLVRKSLSITTRLSGLWTFHLISAFRPNF